ncbi:MAG: hypothetical protein M1826_000563, partial [Phylliscum demangeonii]
EPAISDLKRYLTLPAMRYHLVTTFRAVLSQRLLQPGASTYEILQMYISMIRAFGILDPPGVLIDRISGPIRDYLRERDDTVRVIVAGLAADIDPDQNLRDHSSHAQTEQADVLVDLAVELSRTAELLAHGMDDQNLNWDDMQWTPDPIDAGPGYQRSRASDVLGNLISLFESKDIIIQEYQRSMTDRLLRKDFRVDKEVRLLELLKLRFGDSAMQTADVMLRDVRESKVIDVNVRIDQKLQGDLLAQVEAGTPCVSDLHARILSRLFWPDLEDSSFTVPAEIRALQQRYEKGFENLKQSRKLSWLNTLGQVTVELEFQDRTVIVEDVSTWQASVIYALQDSSPEPRFPEREHTVMDLVDQLDMEETLVRAALHFWTNQRILREIGPDVFKVVERVDDAMLASSPSKTYGGLLSDADADEKRVVAKLTGYWTFIVGMLTNGGPMPLAQIAAMLKFAVAGGFPHTDNDLRSYLDFQLQDGKLELTKGRYKIK